MSGILGTNFNGAHWRAVSERGAAVARARAARDRLVHRGADFAGDWYDDRLFLGHAEQGQLDATALGSQPLNSADGACAVTLDGYLTNATSLHKELQADLPDTQLPAESSHAELIVHAYQHWGLASTLERLRGSFALAIYDRAHSQLVLARDAMGTKPLYYLHEELASGSSGSLMFGSELKALEALANPELLTVDYTAVYDYLTYRYIPAPKTLYQQVRKLAAGQCISFDLLTGHSSSSTFWTLPEPDPARYGTAEEFIEQGRELLEVAVASRISGLTAVAGMCQRSAEFAGWLNKQQNQVRPVTLSIRNENLASVQSPAELRRWFDEPFADVDFAARESLLQQLAGTAPGALSDVGCEVLFGTAPRYRQAASEGGGTVGWLRSKLGTTGAADGKAGSAQESFAQYLSATGGLSAAAKAGCKTAWELPDDYNDYWYLQQYYRADLPRTLRFQHLDLLTLVPEHHLMQLDRQALRHGVEARTPLLDQDLVSWLLAAPAELRGPQFDVQGALLTGNAGSAPVLERLKNSLKGAAALLPGGKAANVLSAPEPLTLLRERFPELGVSGL